MGAWEGHLVLSPKQPPALIVPSTPVLSFILGVYTLPTREACLQQLERTGRRACALTGISVLGLS